MTALNQGFRNANALKVLNETKWKLALEYTNIGVWEFNLDLNKVFFSNESKEIIGFENATTFGDNIYDWNDRYIQTIEKNIFKIFKTILMV